MIITKEMMDNYKTAFYPSLFTKLKFILFGKKIVEYQGQWQSIWYVYNETLYLHKLTNIFRG